MWTNCTNKSQIRNFVRPELRCWSRNSHRTGRQTDRRMGGQIGRVWFAKAFEIWDPSIKQNLWEKWSFFARKIFDEPSRRLFCPHVHLIHRRSEAVLLSLCVSLSLSSTLSSVSDRCRNQNNKDYFNTNRKTKRCDWWTPPSWMVMSFSVRCVGFACEGTGFIVNGGREFSFDVRRGMM